MPVNHCFELPFRTELSEEAFYSFYKRRQEKLFSGCIGIEMKCTDQAHLELSAEEE